MTTFKIKRLAFMKNPRHDEGIPVLTHDEIVVHIIKKMRRSGHHLISYLEYIDKPTIMRFEDRQ